MDKLNKTREEHLIISKLFDAVRLKNDNIEYGSDHQIKNFKDFMMMKTPNWESIIKDSFPQDYERIIKVFSNI